MGWEKSVREKTVRGGDVLTGGQWRNDGTRKGMNTDSIYRVGWRAVAISRISLYFYIGRRRILSPISKPQTKNRADHHSDAEGFFPFENQMRRLPTIGQALYQSFFFSCGMRFFFFRMECLFLRSMLLLSSSTNDSHKERIVHQRSDVLREQATKNDVYSALAIQADSFDWFKGEVSLSISCCETGER